MNYIKRIKHILVICVFTAIFLFLFVKISYLFRPMQEPSSVNRENIVGLYAEPKDSLDVILIGGSSTYVFFAPLEAYKEYGIVSYDFATDSMSPALIKGLMEEARKYQDPKLFIIDLRALDVREEHPDFYSEAYVRGITDGLKYSVNRINTIKYALSYEQPQLKYDLSEYFDLCMYHSNWQNINQKQFDYIDNDVRSPYKGFKMITFMLHESFDKVDYSYVDKEIPLSDQTDQICIDLLEYCQDNELNVLFTLNPIRRDSETNKARYNYIKRIVSRYGYEFIDTNDYYDDMNIDFSHDFYHKDHVNIYGALKYTDFLSKYIVDNYGVLNHRDDANYSEWEELLPEWDRAVDNQMKLIDEAIAQEK